MQEDKIIVLVHGTYGRRSAWARLDHPDNLVSRLKFQGLDNANFERFEWSGRNRPIHRERAARRLAALLRELAQNADTPIHVVAHSHGGNIALAAMELVDGDVRRRLQLVLMATPFSDQTNRFAPTRFEITGLNVYPGFLAFCVFVFLFVFPGLAYREIAQWNYEHFRALAIIAEAKPDAETMQRHLMEAIKWGESPVPVWIDLGPILVAILGVWIWSKSFEWFKEDALPNLSQSLGTFDRILVVYYSQDEAFALLSVLANLFSMMQQILFVLVSMPLKALEKTKVLTWGWAIAWIIFLVAITFTVFGLVLGAFVQVSGFGGGLADIVALSQDRLANLAVQIMVAILISVGFLVLSIFVLLTALGLAKWGILLIGGISHPVKGPRSLFLAVFGSAIVTQSPPGYSSNIVLSGSSIMNHTKIYEDLEAVEAIAKAIGR